MKVELRTRGILGTTLMKQGLFWESSRTRSENHTTRPNSHLKSLGSDRVILAPWPSRHCNFQSQFQDTQRSTLAILEN